VVLEHQDLNLMGRTFGQVDGMVVVAANVHLLKELVVVVLI
jgi:hypothetical protein